MSALKDLTFIDTETFFRESNAIWARAREERRSFLTWEEWYEWVSLAVDCKIVLASDIGDTRELPVNLGMPFRPSGRGVAVDGYFWRGCVMKTYRRVLEARERGLTPMAFHIEEQRALEREKAALENRDKQISADRAASIATRAPRRHAGAAGDL